MWTMPERSGLLGAQPWAHGVVLGIEFERLDAEPPVYP